MLGRNGIGLSKLYLQLGGSSMKKIRNILSIALVFVMLIGFAPVNVFADGPSTGTGTQTPGTGTTVTPTLAQPGEGTPGSTGTPGGSPENPQQPAETVITNIKITSNIAEILKVDGEVKAPDFTVDEANKDKLTVEFVKWQKGDADFRKKTFTEGTDYYCIFKLTATTGPTLAENLKVTLDGKDVTPEAAGEKTYKSVAFSTKPADTTPTPQPQPATEHKITVNSIGRGSASANTYSSAAGKTITVKAYPDSGYIVDSIVVRDELGHELVLRNFEYKNYYNDYPFWYDRFGYKYSYRYNFYDYRSWCYDTSRTVRSFSNYKTWCRLNNYTIDEDDYDDFIYWYDRYDDDDYYNWRYDRSYTYYDKADFTMPESNVTVTVTFTSAPYWRGGYYYDSRTGTYRRYYDDDDYYYYRYRRNKKSNYYERQAKADEEEKDKAEEEKKAPVLKSESRAVITIGSTILNKADMSGQSIMAMDVAAYVKDGRTMLPIRYVAEALGLQVSWVKETRTVLIWDGINRIEIPVDTNKMIVNSVPYINDVKPEMKNGRTMLAVANIARMLGLQDGQDITWDAGKQQVTFVRKIYSK